MNGESGIRITIDVPLDATTAFGTLVADLDAALRRHGLQLVPGPAGRVTQGARELGVIAVWEPDTRIVIEWRPAAWQPDEVSTIELRFDAVLGGTTVTVEERGVSRLLGSGADLTGWFASQLAAPFVAAAAPPGVGDWITDRWARRPSGADARAVYRDPLYHYPNFRVILDELALTPADYLLEVGCGGGALLQQALRSGCRAAAIDHSAEMVRTTQETNRDAVADGRLVVLEACAESLPFPDRTFTCAAMTGVLGFLSDPVAALAEIRRTLRDDGRLVVLGSDPELRGTPGAPEPMASRLQFYDDAGLERLGHAAGFAGVHVIRRDLEAYAREAGVPEEHLSFFAGPGTRFLLARRS